MKEALAIGQTFGGLFTFDGIKNLYWDEYEFLIKEVKATQEKSSG